MSFVVNPCLNIHACVKILDLIPELTIHDGIVAKASTVVLI
jgi:hypothetical protein